MKRFLLVSFLTLPLNFLIGKEKGGEFEPMQKEVFSSSQLKMIEDVLADYRAGRYYSFLKRSDEDFQKSQKEWNHTAFLEERKKLSEVALSHHAVDKKSDLKQKILALQDSKERELLDIALNHPDEKISREVRDMIFFSPSKEEEKSLEFIHQLSLKSKGDGNSPIENQLIAIDTEFWLKTLSLEIAKTQNKIDYETFQKQLFVLHLEKIKQMKNACKENGSDQQIKAHVEIASEILPRLYASAATRKYLHALGRGKISPKNPLEKRCQGVIIKYLQKEEDLIEKHFAQNAN